MMRKNLEGLNWMIWYKLCRKQERLSLRKLRYIFWRVYCRLMQKV